MSSDAKDRVRLAFSPPAGEATVDVLVCSDASAMGANLQRGYHLINYDTPQTAMLHEQRIAREVRAGQENAVSVHDLVADSEFDRRARGRLERKQELRDLITTPAEMMDDSGLAARIERARVKRFEREYSQAGV
jgi:superfamily II DNA/RNA helicase